MSTTHKAQMKTFWQESGQAWDKWANALQAMADKFNQPLIEFAGIQTGSKVLDLASGAGEPALSIAQHIGENGHIIATDLVDEMLAGTQRRATEMGVKNLSCQAADMEALPFENQQFNHVTCRFGIMFCQQQQQALAETLRVLKPQGTATFMVWGKLEENTIFHVIRTALNRVLPVDENDHELLPFALAEEQKLLNMMQEVGFTQCKEEVLTFSPSVPVGRNFWQAQLEMSFAVRYAFATSEQREQIKEEILAGLAAYQHDDQYRLNLNIRLISGTA